MEKVKMKLKYARCKARYFFRPFPVIGACLCFLLIVVLGGGFLLFHVQAKNLYDILMALITGITASLIVAVIIEMTNNYQRNNKRWLLLSRLFGTLSHYSSEIERSTGKVDSNRAHIDFVTKIHQDAVSMGTESPEAAQAAIESASATFKEDEDDEDLQKARDRVCVVFSQLPKIIPLIEEAYHNYEGGFSKDELESMATILQDYENIRSNIEMELWKYSTLKFGLSPKDPGELVAWLPDRIKKDLPDSVVRALAQEVWTAGRKQIADVLIKQGTVGLFALGIELSDTFLDDEADDGAPHEESDDSFPGDVISGFVARIDHELLRLQDIIKTEPGFSTIYDYNEALNSRYRR